MKETEPLHVASLQNMELVAMIKESVIDTEKAAANLLTADVPLQRLTNEVSGLTDRFEAATRNPSGSHAKQEMDRLDKERDMAFRRFGRKLDFFELSANEDEVQTFDVLSPLWKKHSDTPNLNHKKQTGATDNFLNDAAKTPYAAAIEKLAMQTELEAVKTTNNAVKALEKRGREQAAQAETEKAIDLRRELTQRYNFLFTYVWTMASAYAENTEWGMLLTHMNLIRKRYRELISRRRAATKKKDSSEKANSKTAGEV